MNQERLTQKFNAMQQVLFGAPQSDQEKTISNTFLIIEYLIGSLLWAKLFNFGRFSFLPCDWLEQKAYLDVLSNALKTGVIPFHTELPLRTTRFLAIPQTNFFPDAILLKWLSLEQYVLINALLMYSLCFFGCLLIKKQFKLSHAVFVPLVLAFAFNGHIIAHCMVGHPWWGLFLLPFFFYALGRTVEEPKGQIRILALTMAAIALAGSFHCYCWCVLFLLCIACFDRLHCWQYVKAVALSACLSAGRFLPAAISLMPANFEGGYTHPVLLLRSLLIVDSPKLSGYYPWERENFIGFVGMSFLIAFVFIRPKGGYSKIVKVFLPAMTLFTIFSFSNFYYPIYCAHIPLLSAERVTTRFVIMAILAAFFAASLNLQKWLDSNLSRKRRYLMVFILLPLFFGELMFNLCYWTTAEIAGCQSDRWDTLAGAGAIVTVFDPSYMTALIAGWVTSIVTLSAVAWSYKASGPRQASVLF